MYSKCVVSPFQVGAAIFAAIECYNSFVKGTNVRCCPLRGSTCLIIVIDLWSVVKQRRVEVMLSECFNYSPFTACARQRFSSQPTSAVMS